MVDIRSLPLDELETDLAETIEDINLCKMALAGGITTYSGGSVADRLDGNQKIKAVIEAELERRKTA